MGPDLRTLLPTVGLSLGCRADALPSFLTRAVLLHRDNLVHRIPGSPKPCLVSGCESHGKKTIECDTQLVWMEFFEALQVQEKVRKETSQSGHGTPAAPRPAAARGGGRPCPFPRKEIFFSEVSPRLHNLSALTAHGGFAGGKDKGHCLPLAALEMCLAPHRMGALLSPSQNPTLLARGVPGSIMSPAYSEKKKRHRAVFPTDFPGCMT